jgi:multidrug efflux pump subunit AcrA (membrane-fusion protein)
VQVPNADGSLKAGTPVHLSIASRSIPDALVVPSESIVPTSDGKKAVMVIGTDSVAHQKAVTTGIQDNGFVQIRSGLSRGDRVVTQRAYALDDGTRVKVVTAEDDAGKSGESN